MRIQDQEIAAVVQEVVAQEVLVVMEEDNDKILKFEYILKNLEL